MDFLLKKDATMVRTLHEDPSADRFVVCTTEDYQPIFEENQAERNNDTGRYGDGKRVAQIPLSLFYELRGKGIIDNPERLRRWLNDPDNKPFRTNVGRV